MTRYHPLLVALHWLLAIMLLMPLLYGGPALTEMAHDNPDKMFGLTGHMIWGIAVGALMILRLITRLLSKTPPHADAGNAALNAGANWAHKGIYLLVFAMVGSGVGIALSADLFSIVFGRTGTPLPSDFNIYPARVAHGWIGIALLTLIGLHVAGWAYHQFLLRDHLIRRMWFGKRA